MHLKTQFIKHIKYTFQPHKCYFLLIFLKLGYTQISKFYVYLIGRIGYDSIYSMLIVNIILQMIYKKILYVLEKFGINSLEKVGSYRTITCFVQYI